jgi:cell division protein FtsW
MIVAWRQWWQNKSFGIVDELTAKRTLIFSVICLLCLGTVMIGSASMPYGEYINDQPLYFIKRHLIYLLVGIVAAFFSLSVPLIFAQHNPIQADSLLTHRLLF